VFLALMPLSAAFFNYIIPLQIGARDVAFPRLNAFSYWVFLFAGIFMNLSFFLGGAPDGGWYGYATLTGKTFSPGHAIDYWAIGLQVLGRPLDEPRLLRAAYAYEQATPWRSRRPELK